MWEGKFFCTRNSFWESLEFEDTAYEIGFASLRTQHEIQCEYVNIIYVNRPNNLMISFPLLFACCSAIAVWSTEKRACVSVSAETHSQSWGASSRDAFGSHTSRDG
jgi:hypothetical protein